MDGDLHYQWVTTLVVKPFLALAIVAIQALVADDILLLSMSDMIPADGRILMAKDLFVVQAAMIGES
ncbi:hypothetical protein E0H77_09635 [Acinetobacter sp. ANC 4633]|uniref:hypothetical protein n=1 Tax=Acinetobacter sp. ANC 4633 TaxID=2529845 RepID=UPI00103BFEAC|nr:hypothetical protein [Acinetobacter sp. ANC 4633]TCB25323.1 hypothetical protein E0H77_09635 [Acinetobacter sp. ANC 4633]